MKTFTGLGERAPSRSTPVPLGIDATIISVPVSDTDPVFVTFDDQPRLRRGPCFGWAPRYDGSPLEPLFPSPGDPCVVLETESRFAIVTWWPA